jgi:hypothetical protein
LENIPPCILRVEKCGKGFYASNEEYCFSVKEESDELWSKDPIQYPVINGEVVEPYSF